jgi:hypothetical protein
MNEPPSPTAAPSERKGALIQSRALNYKEITLRISLVLLNLGSLALLWWSLQKVLLPLQKQVRDANTTVTRLIAEVDTMESTWPQAAAAQTREKYGEVRAWMFVGRPALESWLDGIKTSVVPMVLDVGFDFSKTEADDPGPAPTNAPAISPTPVALSVRPTPGVASPLSPYQRILQLSQRLTSREKRVDFVELTASSGSNSVGNATLVLHLWSGEESDLQ